MISEKFDSVKPLCKLGRVQRSRICTLVFGFTFAYSESTPIYNFGCAENQITFLTEYGQNALNGDEYYEWMISCYKSIPMYSTFSTYYISYTYEKSDSVNSNYIFTYIRSSKGTSINLTGAYNDQRFGNIFSKK